MTAEEWKSWYPKFRANLSTGQLFELDESEELDEAISTGDYFGAYDLALELVERSN